MSSTNPVRGMRDFLPKEKAQRERVLQSIRATYASHGFVEIETPHLESLTHLLSDQGGDNEKMLFKVQKRGLSVEDLRHASGPDELCDIGLRYDLTVGLSRYYANNRGRLPDILRCMHIGPVWRAERPQKGRYRQFMQCDIDILGEPSALAEVELITTTVKALAELGLDGLTLKINDRRLLTALLRHAGAPEAAWPQCLITIDKLDKIGLAGVTEELAGLLDAGAQQRLSSALADFADPALDTTRFAQLVPEPEVPALAGNLERILEAVGAGVGARKVSLKFDGGLVRGMGYYTGPIFELWHPAFQGAISGGGRYDGMVGRLTGTEVPGTGFSIGFERIIDLVDAPPAHQRPQLALVYDPDVDWGTLVSLQARCVDAGRTARLVPRPKRLGPLLDSLSEEGFASWVEVAKDGSAGEPRELRARTPS